MNELSHPLRNTLVGELHARPFIAMQAEARVAYFVIKHKKDDAPGHAHKVISSLCENFNIDPPEEGSNYFLHEFKTQIFKWERHAEFSSFLIHETKKGKVDFSDDIFANFPESWLQEQAGRVLVSLIVEIPKAEAAKAPIDKSVEPYRKYFKNESMAVAAVLEEAAVIATDFQLDENGHIRFLLIPRAKIGARRLGRIVQRLAEIETYKTASLLALPLARKISKSLPDLEAKLLPIMQTISKKEDSAHKALDDLLTLSAETEQAIASSTFRFSAADAYSEIVNQRINILRESRVAGFQLFSEFMLRRYEPSMRTIASTWQRLLDFSERLERTSELLNTRVDVNNADAQKELLASMDKRAEAQLRLQETVEGLSVVAISYYAVSLLSYMLAPVAKSIGLDKSWLIAILVLPVVLLVWLFIRRMKNHMIKK